MRAITPKQWKETPQSRKGHWALADKESSASKKNPISSVWKYMFQNEKKRNFQKFAGVAKSNDILHQTENRNSIIENRSP